LLGPAPHAGRHPDGGQDPGLRAGVVGALGPDFRQDDGGFCWSGCGVWIRSGPARLLGPRLLPHACRHPDGGQDPGLRAGAVGALGPDFRQDDGGFCWSGLGVWIRSEPAWLLGSRRPPHACRHPDGGQDPGLRAVAVEALDPDFRQDDGGFCWSGCGVWMRSAAAWLLAHGGRPTLVVILTEVGIQGRGRGRLGLWILTFVRMTGGFAGRVAGFGCAARPLGCWPAAAVRPSSSS